MTKWIAFYTLIACIAPMISLAHPGHGGTDGFTIIHYFTELQHAIVNVVLLALIVVYVKLLRRRRAPKQ